MRPVGIEPLRLAGFVLLSAILLAGDCLKKRPRGILSSGNSAGNPAKAARKSTIKRLFLIDTIGESVRAPTLPADF
jgi:hypothetical protein